MAVRYAVYRRVSTTSQAYEGLSLDAQLTNAQQYVIQAGDGGGGLVSDYVDAGVSATKVPMERRKALRAMLADAVLNKFDVLLVYKRDRLARRDHEFFIIRYKLRQAGIRIVYLSPSEPTLIDGPYGDLVENMIASVAALEPKILADRIRSVKQDLRRQGLWHSGVPRFGFAKDPESRMLVIIPSEADVVRWIFHWYVDEGLGGNVISKKLNHEGYLYRRQPNELVQWQPRYINKIISDTKYAGYVVVNLGDGEATEVPLQVLNNDGIPVPIISREQFDHAQRLSSLRAFKNIPPRNSTTSYLLTGLIYCGCGERMLGTGYKNRYTRRDGTMVERDYKYYRCQSRQTARPCERKRWRVEHIHDLVIDECMRVLQPSNLEEVHRAILGVRQDELDKVNTGIRQTKQKIHLLKTRIETMYGLLEGAYGRDNLVSGYEARLEHLHTELNEHEQKLKQLDDYKSNVEGRTWNTEELLQRLTAWTTEFKKASFVKQRQMILDVVKEVRTTDTDDVSITFKFDFDKAKALGFTTNI